MLVRKTDRDTPDRTRVTRTLSPLPKSLLRPVLFCAAAGIAAALAAAPALAATTGSAAHSSSSTQASSAGHSSASTVPCWKRLLNDWYDGTINNIYPLPCYSEAIKHLPLDVQVYSSAKEDILAAEQAAANHKHAPKESNPLPSTSSTTTTTTSTTTDTTPTTTTGGGGTTPTTTTTPESNPPKKTHGVQHVLDELTPGNPEAFPTPLLVLGALAILLVLAGAAGMLWQRAHPRDGGPPPA